ncbi:MAG: tetratricopeptide repeat protein [Xenococcaceae cyanobacterium MO_188.B29]|nr:tetratricopeptide repeat protein [Xenococcaceae cyanobacterium MO_188.B29]
MSNSLSQSYFNLIDRIVDITLKGKIRSKAQVYRMLLEGVEIGTGEVFERCLTQRMETTKAQLETKLKATRILRALQTIEGEWVKWQKSNQATATITAATKQIISASDEERILTFTKVIDLNQNQTLTANQLTKLAQELKTNADKANCQQIGEGITNGLQSFTTLEGDLISWIYEATSNLGFAREKPNPWRVWAKKIDSPLPRQLFQTLSQSQSLNDLAGISRQVELRAWVELAILLQYLQRGLVSWFDRQPYDAKFGKKLSYSTFLTFAAIWCELGKIFSANKQELGEACFQLMLQILRTFARRDDFPLYSGIFVSFDGEYLQNTLEYFSEPLKHVEGTQEKARILTLLAYSQRTLGRYQQAQIFHQEALDIAREAKDQPCEIANLNHLSRTYVQQKEYGEAINYSQRALILARQAGDRLGEANALVNLGYSKVFSARELETMDTESYGEAIRYLEQGVELAEKLGDIQSQSLGCNSLGIAYVILAQPTAAIASLEKGAKLAQISGDVYLQGLSFTYLAEAYYSIEDQGRAIYYGCLSMYLLNQINSVEWRQSAGLMAIIQGQIGEEAFFNLLSQYRSQVLPLIGVDGYDYLSELLQEYKNS